jgi:hypothetical protein
MEEAAGQRVGSGRVRVSGLPSALVTLGRMTHFCPGFQSTGVATFLVAVSCRESITRSTSSKLRPVLAGYELNSKRHITSHHIGRR